MPDSAIDRLRGMLDVAAAVRTGGELRSVLEAVADAVAGPLGYGAVVINLYRPAWDDLEVVVVLGNEESQALLMGPKELGEFQRREYERFKKVADLAGIKPE